MKKCAGGAGSRQVFTLDFGKVSIEQGWSSLTFSYTPPIEFSEHFLSSSGFISLLESAIVPWTKTSFSWYLFMSRHLFVARLHLVQ